ncbi:MAG: hypothetical protein ABIS01_01830, partial [Ferruginibacter sp.]
VKPILCAEPEKAFCILQAADGGVVAEPVLYLVVPEIIRLAIKTIYKKQKNRQYKKFSVQWHGV